MARHSASVKPSVEERLEKLEAEMAQLRAETEREGAKRLSTVGDLLKHVHGAFENDPDFGEVVEFGRRWRKSQRSPTKTGKSKNVRARH